MRQTIKRRFHALKVKLAERPAKYLARRYDAGQGLAARLLSVSDAPHPPEQPDQQLLVAIRAHPLGGTQVPIEWQGGSARTDPNENGRPPAHHTRRHHQR